MKEQICPPSTEPRKWSKCRVLSRHLTCSVSLPHFEYHNMSINQTGTSQASYTSSSKAPQLSHSNASATGSVGVAQQIIPTLQEESSLTEVSLLLPPSNWSESGQHLCSETQA